MTCLSRRQIIAAAIAAPFAMRSALAAGDRAAIVRKLAELLASDYQDEAAARRLADAVLGKLAAGEYGEGGSDADFAAKLTADLLAVVPDKHMAVMFGMPADQADPSMDPVFVTRMNCGVQRVARLKGNVGLIGLNLFPALSFGDKLTGRYAAAMALVADTRALIVDVRGHMGGDPPTVAYFASYFFDRAPFLINEIHYRRGDVDKFSTTDAPAGPKYGEARPVLVLTSAQSFSGAEEFAYDLQVTQRARLVGEVTGGGANPNELFDLGGGFTVLIPNGRAVNPVTGTNWEGVGVKPDVPTAAADAEGAAHVLALEGALAQASEEGERKSIQSALNELKG